MPRWSETVSQKGKLWTVLLFTIQLSGAVCPSCQVSVGAGIMRVQALSPTLLRVEPKGPYGFEDRATFTVVNRSFAGIPVSAHDTVNGTNVTTPYYSVLVRHDGSFAVYGLSGQLVHDSATSRAGNLLHWPSPLTAAVYALEDRPRFVPPPWAPQSPH